MRVGDRSAEPAPTRDVPVPGRAPEASALPPPLAAVLALQSTAGNAAVAQLLKVPPREIPSGSGSSGARSGSYDDSRLHDRHPAVVEPLPEAPAARRPTGGAPVALLALHWLAGNAAAGLVVQRDDPAGSAPPAGAAPAPDGAPAAAAGPAPTIQITAVQQPTTGGAPAAPGGGASPAPGGGAAPAPGGGPAPAPAGGTDGGAPGEAPAGLPDKAPPAPGPAAEPGPWQLQYSYQGQKQWLGEGQPPQNQMAQQVAVNLNLQQLTGGSGAVQPSIAVQGSFDPTTGAFTGAQAQAQVALVANVMKDVQAQLYAQGSAGVAADQSGTHATAGVAAGVQASYNVSKDVQIFAQVQGGANTTAGEGGGPAIATSAGVTWTFP